MLRKTKLLIGLFAALIILTPYVANAATLNQLLRQKTDLQKQAEANRQKLDQKKREGANLQNVIEDLDGDIAYTINRIKNTQSQIDVTENIISGLNADIEENEQTLAGLDGQLRTAYVTIYELAQTSTVEIFTSGQSLSDIISRTQYIEAIQSSLMEKINIAKQLKDSLESKKRDSESQKASLQNLNKVLADSKANLAGQRAGKDSLLRETQGEQAKYEALLRKLSTDQEKIDKQIYEARRRSAGQGEQIFYGGSNYPWASEPNPAAIDPWFFYKRQCVSYTAWKIQATYGKVFTNTRPGQGNAWNWPALARDQGYQTSSTPTAGAVVSWPIGQNRPYGHTAWVESVNADGTINVSEYNWVVERGYSERRNVNPLQYGTPTYITP